MKFLPFLLLQLIFLRHRHRRRDPEGGTVKLSSNTTKLTIQGDEIQQPLDFVCDLSRGAPLTPSLPDNSQLPHVGTPWLFGV